MIKVGDRVKFRSDLEVGHCYGGCIWSKSNNYYLGKEATVEYCFTSTDAFRIKDPKYGGGYFTAEMLDQNYHGNSEIHITTDGATVHAVMKENGKVIKRSKAVCSPDDKFNFQTGAKIALERLKEPEFVPCLMLNGHIRFGTIGEKTNMTALFGEELFVGDIVEIYSTLEDEDGSHCHETHFVTKDSHGFRVDGLARGKIKNGIYGVWQIQKVKSYKDLKNNESVGYITAVLEEPNHENL